VADIFEKLRNAMNSMRDTVDAMTKRTVERTADASLMLAQQGKYEPAREVIQEAASLVDTHSSDPVTRARMKKLARDVVAVNTDVLNQETILHAEYGDAKGAEQMHNLSMATAVAFDGLPSADVAIKIVNAGAMAQFKLGERNKSR
jgi:hypothetical protein